MERRQRILFEWTTYIALIIEHRRRTVGTNYYTNEFILQAVLWYLATSAVSDIQVCEGQMNCVPPDVAD